MIKFLTFVLVFVSGTISPLMAGDFDGKYTIKITSNDPNPICAGFLVSEDIQVSNGKITGSIQHVDSGSLDVSGSIRADGSAADVEANSSAAFVTIRGSLKTLKGTWSESRSECEGTWSASR